MKIRRAAEYHRPRSSWKSRQSYGGQSYGGQRRTGDGRRLVHEALEDRRLLSVQPFPLPLEAVDPRGGLIYGSAAGGDIAAAGETDSLTVDLDDPQTVTLVVDPQSSLRPAVDLLDPAGTVIASAQATAPGREAVLQVAPTTGAGTYSAVVSGLSNTLGGYSVELTLNAAVEDESHGGPANDGLAVAQDLDATFFSPGGAAAQRGAVIGSGGVGVVGIVPGQNAESGFISISGSSGAQSADVSADVSAWANGRANNGWGILPTGSNGVRIRSFEYGTPASRPQLLLTIPGGPVTITTGVDTYIRSGPSYRDSSYGTDPDVEWDGDDGGGANMGLIWFDVPQATLDAFRDTPGSRATLRYQVFDNGASGELHRMTTDWVSGPGGGNNVTYNGMANLGSDDWYSFTLEAGQSATMAAASQTGAAMTLQLYDPGQHLLAVGVPAGNADYVIGNLTAADPGDYYASVSGGGAQYSLVVTRGAAFDTEGNSDLSMAQQLAGTDAALGYLSGTAPGSSMTGGGGKGPAADAKSDPAAAAVSDHRIAATPTRQKGDQHKYAPGRMIVRFADSATDADKARVVAAHKATVRRELSLINGLVVELSAAEANVLEAVRSWSADPAVLYAEPDYYVRALATIPNDPRFPELWGMHNTGQTGGTVDADIDAPEAWDSFTGSSTVVIAGIDTGIDYNHEDLAANMWVNPGEIDGDGIDNDGNGYIDDIYGINAVADTADPMDDHYHGTHTAGTFGGVGNNGIGVAGVAWEVEIMALKFLDSGGGGFTDDAIACLDYMTMMKTDYGVNLVASNNSWGGGGFSQALKDAIEASNDAGIMFVAAAGNSGMDADLNPHYPSSYDLDGIISVAATDHDDLRAGFSNWGAISVDLGAPGVDTLSTFPNNDYGDLQGTSMASPHVAGAVGMMMAYSPEATLEEVKAAVMEGVDLIDSMDGITVSGGRLNLATSLSKMGDPGDFYSFQANPGDELTIGTSTPGDGPLQFDNLLDPIIELYDPDGNMVAGNDNGAADGRNARLTYTTDAGGSYTVRVLAAAEKGEYLLELAGATGGLPPFAVSRTDPADGQRLASVPTQMTVYFDDTILLGSLDPPDLTVNGMAATGVLEVPHGRAVTFALPGLGEGDHNVAIAAGAVLDVQETPIEAYAGQFTVDLTGPQVVASSLAEGEIVIAGDLVYTVQFNEELLAGDLDPTDVTLEGVLSGSHSADAFAYDPAGSVLTLQFDGLPEDDYTLTLLSGDGQFEDLVGNDLDGSPSFPLPSGNGAPGGDYVLHFSLDVDRTDAAEFWRLEPLGGMILSSEDNLGLVNFVDDPDDFVFFAEAGQKVAAVVYPQEPTATLSLELVGLSGPVTASGPGMPAVLPPAAVPGDGDYTVRVVGDTHGPYQLTIGQNFVTEVFDTDTGSGLSVSESYVSLGSGRFGLLGNSEAEPIDLESIVWGVQPQTGQIVVVDPATGGQLYAYDAPDALSPNHTQIGLTVAEGGRSLLYVNSDVDSGSLYRLRPMTGVVRSVERTAGRTYDGLGYEIGDTSGGIVYAANMDTNPGWALEDEWEWGTPQGLAGDPSSGNTGSNVIGFNLAGAYPNGLPAYYATTPPIDASQFENVTLSFYRWLGVEGCCDEATVQVSNNGATWTTVWDTGGQSFYDDSWTQETIDISAVADGQPTVYVRWGMGPTDGSVTYCGWNVDDVLITGDTTLPPNIFLGEDSVAVRRQEGFSGPEFSHLGGTAVSGAVGGDGMGRQFAFVPGTGIVEYDPHTPDSVIATLPAPAVDIEGLAYSGLGLFASTASGNLYTLDADTGAVLQTVSIAGGGLFGLGSVTIQERTLYEADMNANPGWTFQGEWAYGVPAGIDGDPSSGNTGSNVVGYNLFGEYPDNMLNTLYATTPAFDASRYSDVTLSFYRWLGVESASYDHANIEVSNDGASWTTVWEHTGSSFSDTAWTPQTFDISSVADGQSSVYLRWGMGPTDMSVTYCGWNVDDVVVTGTLGPGKAARGSGIEYVIPDPDEYQLDLTGMAGHPIDVVLAGQDGEDFSSARLELLDADGQAVLATAAFDPLGAAAENYQVGILDFMVPADGFYTLRVAADTMGQYGILVTDRLVFDSEPNDGLEDALRSLDGLGTALGYVGAGGGRGMPLLFVVEWRDPTPTTIHTLDALTGEILASFDSPVTPTTNPFGFNVAFDGENLYYNAGSFFGDNTIYVLDARDGTVLDSYTAGSSISVLGLGYVGGELFVMDDSEGDIDVYDALSGAYSRSFTPPSWALTGIAGDDASNLLYAVDQMSKSIFQMDPATGTLLGSGPTGLSNSEQGMAVVGDELFVSETGGFPSPLQDVVVYDAVTFAEVRRFTMPFANTMVSGLGGDGVMARFSPAGSRGRTLDDPPQSISGSGDLYELTLEAGQMVLVTTETPLDGSGNELDPALALFASGDLIQNGSFETGDFTGWTATSNGVPEVLPWTVGPGSQAGRCPILITEAGTGDPDFVEIQNVGGSSMATAGWFVVANDATDAGHPADINAFHQTLWNLPAAMPPGEILYRSDIDDGTGNFWGENIFWRAGGPGWVMMVDDQGTVADFVVWGYTDAEIASLSINVGGFDLTAADAWSGPSVPAALGSRGSAQRQGSADHDDASDWAFVDPTSMGLPNDGLDAPFFASWPLDGTYSAYNGFNGDAGLQYQLYQDVAIPNGTVPLLTTNHRIQYSGNDTAQQPRRLEISVRDTDGNLLETLYTEMITPLGPPVDLGWNTQTFDLAAYAGQTVRIHFFQQVPEPYTGSALIEFDQISLIADTRLAFDHDTEDGKNARMVFTATESDTYTLEVLAEEGGGEYLLKTEIYDTAMPLLRIDDVEVVEGDAGTVDAVFNVRLMEDPPEPITVRLNVYDQTATVADSDYLPLGEQTLQFDPGGALVQQVTVVVNGDPDIEPREAFIARLSDPTAAVIADPHGVGSILNDDTEILVVEGVELLEGDREVTPYVFNVSLVAPADVPVTVDYTSLDGSATTADQDYRPVAGLLKFDPNVVEQTITVEVLADTQIEGHELFYLDFSNPSQPISGLRSTGSVLNEDTEISIDDVTLPEGDTGVTEFQFGVTLAAPSAVPVTVRVDTADRTAAVKDDDYAPVDNVELKFEPGETAKTVTVTAYGDTRPEDDETFRVNLNDASQPLARSQGLGTILDDDGGNAAMVVGRHLFYNNSSFDGNDAALGARDDDAVASDKQALLPGRTATFANYSSFVRGINGLMIDIAGLPGVPTAADFTFKVGNDDNPAGWTPLAAVPTIAVREADGTSGSDRVTIVWGDGAIAKQWLQVTVLPTAATGLRQKDVFYFGNAIGETGNSTSDAKVSAVDMLGARDNQRSFLNPAPIQFEFDFNRDTRVNVVDMLISRDNSTHFLNALKLITVPDGTGGRIAADAEPPAARDATLPAKLQWLHDFEAPHRAATTAQEDRSAAEVVDAMLATGWI